MRRNREILAATKTTFRLPAFRPNMQRGALAALVLLLGALQLQIRLNCACGILHSWEKRRRPAMERAGR
jgi:hypothetical protein